MQSFIAWFSRVICQPTGLMDETPILGTSFQLEVLPVASSDLDAMRSTMPLHDDHVLGDCATSAPQPESRASEFIRRTGPAATDLAAYEHTCTDAHKL